MQPYKRENAEHADDQREKKAESREGRLCQGWLWVTGKETERVKIEHVNDLALFRNLCTIRQLSRKNKFDKLSGMFPALVFVAF